ncbi:beta strand repeat-containing protein [Flaviaesturariibacter amylovorans]|uniref:Ig-like domain-containing protein n=1 Tax=Flaviaesturariibacter amylovorans TaxID=1084520 RepID=A0ABP8GDI6_9BACT
MRKTIARKLGLLAASVCLALSSIAQSGTADGTYVMGTLGALNSGGTGFRKLGDKFVVSNIFIADGSSNIFINQGTNGAAETVVWKAENGVSNPAVLRTFTFKDLTFYAVTSTSSQVTHQIHVFTLLMKDYYGNTIAQHELASPFTPVRATTSSNANANKVSLLPFTSPWPAAGYNNVASITLTIQFTAASNVSVDELNFNKITIANASAAIPTSLAVGTISGSPFCAGASVSIPYTSSGINSGNTFTAQLSDGSGSFASPVTLGTASGNAASGTISGTIPAATATGTGYRIRIVSNDPAVTSSDNGSNLTINAKPSATISSTTNVACNGGSTGALTAAASGGTPGYNYSWSPSGGTNATATGLTAGAYSVTVSDSKGCTASAPATITQPSALSVSTAKLDVACYGGATGTASVSVSGGTGFGTYTYSWSPSGGTGNAASGLTAGNYTVTITDANSCQATRNFTINQPSSALSATTVVSNVSCFGGNNGTINLTPSGGTAPYSYNWGGGVTTEDRTGLAAGTYSVTVTDDNGCVETLNNITVGQPATAVSGTTVVTNVACFGGNTGAINLTPTGGTGTSYSYNWIGSGVTTEDRTNLTAGTYQVQISDEIGCTGTVSNISVSQPTSPVSGTTVVTNVACFGGNNGAINLTPTGGVGNYTYNWQSGPTTQDRTNLIAGFYTVTITDDNGCTGTVSNISVSQPASPVSGTTVVTNVACFGGTNGAINLTPSGGVGNYTYNWIGGGVTTQDRTGLAAGLYTVVITDNNGCTGTISNISVTQPSSPVSGTTVVTAASCAGSDGAIDLTPTGGTGPYTYNWIGSGVTSQDRSGLAAGTYSVQITDDNGCTGTVQVTVGTNTPTVNTVSNQTVCAGNSTSVTFSGANASSYTWTNNNTAIGLPASGTGNIASFTTTNAGNTPIVATITVTPQSAGCSGTATSFTITVNPAVAGGALSFGTGNDYAISNANIGISGNAPRTIEYYAQLSGTYAHQLNWGSTGNTNQVFGTFTINNRLYVYGWGPGDYEVPNFVTDGNWHHVAVTYNGTVIKVYIDGVEKTPAAGVARSYNTANGRLVIGMREDINNNVAAFTGKMDEVRVWNRALCFAEINNNRNGELQLPQAGLVAYYKMNAGTADCNNAGLNTLTDATGSNHATLVNFALSGSTSNWTAGYVSGNTPVYTAPSATIAYGASPYAVGTGTAAVTFTGTTGGTFSSTTGLSINGSTGTINLAASQPGTYTVTYQVSAAGGCDPFSTTTSVTLVNPFSATIAYGGSPYCDATGTATVTRTGTTGGTYSATPAGLAIDATTGTIDLGASQPGTYTVRYGTSPSDFTTTQVTIRPASAVNPTPNYTYCAGAATSPIVFTGIPGLSYSWTSTGNTGMGTSGTGTIPSFTATNNGTSPVEDRILVMAQGGTGCGALKPHVFRLTVNPTPALSTPSAQVLCAGSNASVAFAASLAGSTVSWTNNNTAIGLGAIGTDDINPFMTVNNTGSVQVATITATPRLMGCTGTPVSTTITVNPAAGTIAYDQAAYCQAGPAYLRNSGATGGVYTSTPGLVLHPATGVVNLAQSTPGTYTVTYTVASGGGCAATAATSITINPQASVDAPNNRVFCTATNTTPIVFTGSAASYSWTNDNPAIGLSASGTGNIPSFMASAGDQTAVIHVTPVGNGSTTCPGKTRVFRIYVRSCAVTISGDTGGDASTSRISTVQVSPNPSVGLTTVTLTQSGSYTLQLVNRLGAPMSAPRAFTGNRTQVDLSGLTPGSYLLRIVNTRTGEVKQQQVIKL